MKTNISIHYGDLGRREFDPIETGRRIRKKRKTMGYSLEEFVDHLWEAGWKISVNSVGKWERGEIDNIKWDNIIRLCEFFSCSLDELVACRDREIGDERDGLVPFHILFRTNICISRCSFFDHQPAVDGFSAGM